jgi:hypothetical protein
MIPYDQKDRPGRSRSGRRGSNPRPQPWQGCALPAELLPQGGAMIAAGRDAPPTSSSSRRSESATPPRRGVSDSGTSDHLDFGTGVISSWAIRSPRSNSTRSAAVVDEDHLDLAAVAAVDQSRRVDHSHPVAGGMIRTAGAPVRRTPGDRNSQSGRCEHPFPGSSRMSTRVTRSNPASPGWARDGPGSSLSSRVKLT